MLAEGWKEANIRMGLLGLGEGESQDLKQGNRTLSPERAELKHYPQGTPVPRILGSRYWL